MEKKIAKDLLSIGAVFLRPEQPFTWASGIKSPIYCDNRLTLTAPVVRGHVEAGLAEIVRTKFPEAEVLMGTSTAGIAHAAITATILDLPMGYVRSGSKDHGRGNQIEGKLEKGQKVFVIEDIMNLLQNQVPWVLSGFSTAGGMMPAVGLAMLLTMMMKKNMWIFLLAGFIMAAFLNVPTVGIALAACAAAGVWDVITEGQKNQPAPAVAPAAGSDDDEEYDL